MSNEPYGPVTFSLGNNSCYVDETGTMIFYFGGDESLRIDPSGRLNKPLSLVRKRLIYLGQEGRNVATFIDTCRVYSLKLRESKGL